MLILSQGEKVTCGAHIPRRLELNPNQTFVMLFKAEETSETAASSRLSRDFNEIGKSALPASYGRKAESLSAL
jgi:hypothetical protein